jgi:hypothetical protein
MIIPFILIFFVSIIILIIFLLTRDTCNLTPIEKTLDRDYLIKNTKNYSKLPTRLDKTIKGTSLIANKDIKKGDLLAYYKMKVYNSKDYKGINDNMYTFNVYNKANKHFRNLIADVYEDSIEQPINGITFWGHLANEPSVDQKPNSKIVTQSNKNLEGDIKDGDIIVYELVATKDIKKDDEITWCYGGSYKRNYKICKDCEKNTSTNSLHSLLYKYFSY